MDRRVVATAAGAVAVIVSLQVVRWIYRRRERADGYKVSLTLNVCFWFSCRLVTSTITWLCQAETTSGGGDPKP